jgi:glyoxylase-like metal-dependent hydrolase (beta-lactamase superfamily II)
MSTPTRRRFLGSAPALAGVPSVLAQEDRERSHSWRPTPFVPPAAPRRLSENLFLFEDTCNVYLIRDGASCILVDFGSGAVLDHLAGLGVSRVEWILHTHHHRDQCQGDWRAVQRSIPIAVPAHERHFFADAENFWRNRRVFHLYYVRNDFNTLTRNVPVARALEDYSTFHWKGVELFVLPAPGHTLGSVALLGTVDGKRVAFSGDLIYAPGKIYTLHDTQVNYGGAEGVDLGIYSLARLRERKPELLAPSHGGPIADPDPAIAETMRRLSDYYRFQTGNDPVEENRPYAVSPHLVAHYTTNSAFYTIVSDSGKAMFIDYGSASQMHFANFLGATAATDRIRFVEHNIDVLRRDFGMKSIDVALPSHMHDDHINGFPHLIRRYGTKIWCYENMVDVLEHPRGYNLGCILAEPFRVDRTFRHGERFRWEEFEFEVTHSPGHTEYQMALFVTIDGQRVAFTGDAFFPPREPGIMRHNLIFRNHVENDSHLKSIRNLIERDPTLIAPGHGRPFAVDRALMEATLGKFRKQQQWFFDLLPEGEADAGLDPGWVSIYPYQLLIAPGDRQSLEIRVQNYSPAPAKMEVALVAPREWGIEPRVDRFSVPGRGTVRRPLSVTIPKAWEAPGARFAIAADVVRDGRYLGEITEAVVEMKGTLDTY